MYNSRPIPVEARITDGGYGKEPLPLLQLLVVRHLRVTSVQFWTMAGAPAVRSSVAMCIAETPFPHSKANTCSAILSQARSLPSSSTARQRRTFRTSPRSCSLLDPADLDWQSHPHLARTRTVNFTSVTLQRGVFTKSCRKPAGIREQFQRWFTAQQG